MHRQCMPCSTRRLIIHYVSRDAMDITAWAAIVDQLLGELIDDAGDLYYLDYDHW